jgi:hypothetical protein
MQQLTVSPSAQLKVEHGTLGVQLPPLDEHSAMDTVSHDVSVQQAPKGTHWSVQMLLSPW